MEYRSSKMNYHKYINPINPQPFIKIEPNNYSHYNFGESPKYKKKNPTST